MFKQAAILSWAVVLTWATLGANTSLGQDWARKMFDSTEHKFGAVARGAKVEHRFTITNLYEEDAHIASVRSSCGCTTPTVEKRDLKTFEKAELVAVFNTRTFEGDKNATLTVTFDKPFFAEVQVQISGYIRKDVVLDPGLVDFGSINQGTPVEKRIVVNYAGRSDWKITDVQTANQQITAQLTEISRQNGQVKYDLLVRLTADAPAGYIKEQLLLMTNDSRSKQLPVDVEGHVTPSVSVSPASLHMGVLQPGQKVTKQLVVKAQKEFRIKGMKCEDGAFSFDQNDDSKSLHIVPVTFVAGDKTGKVTQKICIETDIGDLGKLECQVYALVVEARE